MFLRRLSWNLPPSCPELLSVYLCLISESSRAGPSPSPWPVHQGSKAAGHTGNTSFPALDSTQLSLMWHDFYIVSWLGLPPLGLESQCCFSGDNDSRLGNVSARIQSGGRNHGVN